MAAISLHSEEGGLEVSSLFVAPEVPSALFEATVGKLLGPLTDWNAEAEFLFKQALGAWSKLSPSRSTLMIW